MENSLSEANESQPDITPEQDCLQPNPNFETLLQESVTETNQIDFKKLMVGIFKTAEKLTGESLPTQSVQERNKTLEAFEFVFDGLRNDFPINVEMTSAEFKENVADALNEVEPIDDI